MFNCVGVISSLFLFTTSRIVLHKDVQGLGCSTHQKMDTGHTGENQQHAKTPNTDSILPFASLTLNKNWSSFALCNWKLLTGVADTVEDILEKALVLGSQLAISVPHAG